MNGLFAELQRRNVFRVAGVYAVAGWLLTQVAATLEGAVGLPGWFDGMVVSLLLIGFPIAVILAWAFELTPEGVKRTRDLGEGESIAPRTGKTLDYAILAGLALVVIVVVADWLTPKQAQTVAASDAGISAAPPDASIAVLPFADLSPAGDQEYFADGISEEILNVLAKIDGLKVASRTSSFAFRDQGDISAPAIAKELSVRHLLEGSVRKAGATLRITGQLIDAEGDRHLWSETYDRPLTAENVFAIQDEIAGAIVAALGEVIGTAPVRARTEAATTDLSAYDLYLEARALYQERTQIDRAEALLAQAVERDPEFADAWALRAAAASLYLFFEYVKTDLSREALEQRVDEYAARARALDPANALAIAAPANYRMNATLGLTRAYDLGEVVADLEKAVVLDPRDSSVRNWLGITYLAVGEREKALETFTACTEFDPLFGPCAENLYDSLVTLERYDEAWTVFQRVLSRGMKVGGWVSFSLLAHFEEKMAFMIAADHDQWLPGWRRQDEIYEAFRNPGADHSELVAAVTDFVRGNPQVNVDTVGILLIPIGGFDYRPYATTLWAPDHARYRRSPQFYDYVVKSGIYDYWRRHGFPRQCKPVGDDRFECE
ncbi:MAG TPA: hypothetical protein VLB07_03370 [Woeseiaceae bacterium]|nr:hypothetical protein [Woeseiaceae bacterium]